MNLLTIKGPVSESQIRYFSNDLGGAVWVPFEPGENGNWSGGINDHALDVAIEIANHHGLVLMGMARYRIGRDYKKATGALPRHNTMRQVNYRVVDWHLKSLTDAHPEAIEEARASDPESLFNPLSISQEFTLRDVTDDSNVQAETGQEPT